MAADAGNEGGANDSPEIGNDESLPIGQRLRAGREKVGLSEAQVGQALNLDQSVVRALEAGDFDSLGAPIFVKGHLRNYARLVKLDPAAIIGAYEVLERSAPPELPVRGSGGVRMDESGGWGSRVAWVVLALIVAAIGYWLYQTNQLSGLVSAASGPQTNGAVQPLPATRSPPPVTIAAAQAPTNALNPLPHPRTIGATVPKVGASNVPANGTPNQRSAPGVAPSAAKSAAVGTPPAQTKTATATVPSAETRAKPAATAVESQTVANLHKAEAKGGLPIALRLTGDSWVEVDDANGKRLYYGLAHQGDTLYITGEPPLSVFLGNAPVVRVLVAGNVIDDADYTRSDSTARFTIHKLGDNPAYADEPTSLGAGP